MVQAIIEIINKVLSFFTPKQRVVRLKQELRDLENERIMLLSMDCTATRIKRINAINSRIDVISEQLRDHASG